MSRQVLTTLVWWKTRWKTYRYKICICSVILGQNLSLFEIYIRASVFNYASVNSSWAQLPPCPPGLLRGHLQILRWSTPVSYQNILHRGFYWKNKQIGSSVKDRKKLKRFVKTYSRFYACISCLSSQNYITKSGAIDVNQRFFGLLNQISVDIIWRTSFDKTIHNS